MKHMLHKMHKLISVSYRKGLLVALIGGAISLWLAQSSSAMEVANKQQPNQLLYDTEQSKLIVNGEALQLDQAPAIVGEKLYMPLKFLSQFFRLELSFDATNSKVAATGKDFKLVFNMKDQSLELNDEMLDQRNLAFM